MTSGIYFLANDAVIEWARAFLASVRKHNPSAWICHIPFDDNCKEIRRLSASFGCGSIDDSSVRHWDEIGRRFYPDSEIAAHTFRKLAVFDGPIERFIFLDIDTIVLSDLSFCYEALLRADIAFYRHAHLKRNFASEELACLMDSAFPEYNARGFNSGFIVGRRGALDIPTAERLARRSDTLSAHIGPAWEQGFLNLCCAFSGLRATRLPALFPDLSVNWDCFLDVENTDSGYITGTNSVNANCEITHGPGGAVPGKRVVALHWGGHRNPHAEMPNFDLWKNYLSLSEINALSN